jgi:hypothetical protein
MNTTIIFMNNKYYECLGADLVFALQLENSQKALDCVNGFAL